jgi:hypothetical protein
MSTDFPSDVISAEDYERMRTVHQPLTQAVRDDPARQGSGT